MMTDDGDNKLIIVFTTSSYYQHYDIYSPPLPNSLLPFSLPPPNRSTSQLDKPRKAKWPFKALATIIVIV